MKQAPATFLPAVPPIYERLAADGRESAGSTCRRSASRISGAMTLPAEIVELWEDATGGLLVEGYGMTETSPVALGNPVSAARRPGTVGVPFPSTEVRVVDPDDPADELGRRASAASCWCAAPGVHAATGAARRDGEALLDGRLAAHRRHRRGRRGRLRHRSSTGSRSSSSPAASTSTPRRSRRRCAGVAGVADAAVVGVPGEDRARRSSPRSWLDGRGSTDVEAVRATPRETAPPTRCPRRVVVVDELPRSLIGKVLRREVRESLLSR